MMRPGSLRLMPDDRPTGPNRGLMNNDLPKRIAEGRTDLVFEYLANGHPAKSTDDRGSSLIDWLVAKADRWADQIE